MGILIKKHLRGVSPTDAFLYGIINIKICYGEGGWS